MQVIPHITNEIKARIRAMDGPDVDIVITEIGGTVGDIESLPFLEAARQVRHDVGRDNVFFLHVSLLPYIGPSGELKTKPTQHSVAALRSIGIQPDAIVLRADRPVPTGIKRKISLMCDVDEEAVVAAVDAPSIYDIPKVLHSEGLDAYVVRRLGLPFRDVDWTDWDELLRRVHRPAHEVTVALVGKYVDLPDAYLSVTEALRAGGFANDARVNLRWVTSDDCATPEGAGDAARRRRRRAACPAGSAYAASRASSVRCTYAREHGIPTLGPVPRPAVHGDRVRARPSPASTARTRPSSTRQTPHPVIATMADQLRRRRRRARHGRHDAARALPGRARRGLAGARGVRRARTSTSGTGTATRSTTPTATSSRPAGLVFSGTSPDGRLVEYVELPREVHPYYVGTQAHPELAVAADARAPALHRAGPGRSRPQGRPLAVLPDTVPRRLSAVEHPVSGAESRPAVARPVRRVTRSSRARTCSTAGCGTWSPRPCDCRAESLSSATSCEHPAAVARAGARRAGARPRRQPVPPRRGRDVVGAPGRAARRRG